MDNKLLHTGGISRCGGDHLVFAIQWMAELIYEFRVNIE